MQIDKRTHIFQNTNLPFILPLRTVHPLPNTNKLPINVLQTSRQRVPQRLLDLPLHKARREGFEGLIQKVMLRVPNGKLKRVDFDVDRLDFEYGGSVMFGR
jgi:hypothetical protein